MPSYPSNYVLPSTQAYTGVRSAGLIQSAAPTPEPNQIQTFNAAITELSFTFEMRKAVYGDWIAWVRLNAYDWFTMPVVGPYTPDYITSDCRVRFISDVVFNYAGHDWYSVTVSAELVYGDESENGASKVYNDFIVAGTPAVPAVDYIVAGTPALPATDTITADLYGYEFVRA